jgi:hypothetical protein
MARSDVATLTVVLIPDALLHDMPP